MLTNQSEEITAEEFVHLAQIMNEYDVRCDMEASVVGMPGPFITVWDSSVDIEFFYRFSNSKEIFVQMGSAGIDLGGDKYRFYKDVVHFQNFSRVHLTASSDAVITKFYSKYIPPIAWEEVQREQEEEKVC